MFRRDARQLRVYTCRRAWKQVVCLSVLVVLAILLVWVPPRDHEFWRMLLS